MVRMDRLLDAWRADPRVDATVELCAMLIRAALKASPQKLLPDDFVIGFANEARTRHPSNLDVSIAITDLYLSTGLMNHAIAVLDMAARVAPTDNRVKDRLDKLGRRRRTQEFSAQTSDPDTLDAPTSPADPPTEPEGRGAPPPLPAPNPRRRPTTIGLSAAAPPPLPGPKRTASGVLSVVPPAEPPKEIRDEESTHTEAGMPTAMRANAAAQPKAGESTAPAPAAPTGAHPRRQKTFLFGSDVGAVATKAPDPSAVTGANPRASVPPGARNPAIDAAGSRPSTKADSTAEVDAEWDDEARPTKVQTEGEVPDLAKRPAPADSSSDADGPPTRTNVDPPPKEVLEAAEREKAKGAAEKPKLDVPATSARPGAGKPLLSSPSLPNARPRSEALRPIGGARDTAAGGASLRDLERDDGQKGGLPRRAAVKRPPRVLGPSLEGGNDNPTKVGPVEDALGVLSTDMATTMRKIPPLVEPIRDEDSDQEEAPTYARPLAQLVREDPKRPAPIAPPAPPPADRGPVTLSRPATEARVRVPVTDARAEQDSETIPRERPRLGPIPVAQPSDPETETATAVRPPSVAPGPGMGPNGMPPMASPQAIVDEPSGVHLEEDDDDEEGAVTGLREPPPAMQRPARFGIDSGGYVPGVGRNGTLSMNATGEGARSASVRPPDDDEPRTYVLTPEEAAAASRVDPRPPHARSLAAGHGPPHHADGNLQSMHGGAVQRGHVVGAGSAPPPSSAAPMFAGAAAPTFAGAAASLSRGSAPPAAPTFGPPPSMRSEAMMGQSGGFAQMGYGPASQPFVPPPFNPQQSGVAPAPQFGVAPVPSFGPPPADYGLPDPLQQAAILQAAARGIGVPSAPAPPPPRPIKLYAAIGVAVIAVALLVAYATYLLVSDRGANTAPASDVSPALVPDARSVI